MGAVTAASTHSTLGSVLRTRIAEDLLTTADVVSTSPVEAVAGVSLTVTDTSAIFLIISQAQLTAFDGPASNGIIHQIDQVLNAFTGYFGMTNATTSSPLPTPDETGTTADSLFSEARPNALRDILLTLQPDVLTNRLRLIFPAATPLQVFMAPSNTAFSAAPPGDRRIVGRAVKSGAVVGAV